MALLPMKRLVAAIPKNKQLEVVRSLCALSCVEVEPCTDALLQQSAFFTQAQASDGSDDEIFELKRACSAISGFAEKRGLFTPKISVSADEMQDDAFAEEALQTARAINGLTQQIEKSKAEQARCGRGLSKLSPWEPLDVPLGFKGTEKTLYLKGTLPATASLRDLNDQFAEQSAAACAKLVSKSERAQYVEVMVFKKHSDMAAEVLKKAGFVEADLTYGVDAADEVSQLHNLQWKYEDEQRECENKIKAYAKDYTRLLAAQDAFALRAQQDTAMADFSHSDHLAIMQGWLPTECEEKVSAMLEKEGCAYGYADPQQGDRPPTAIKNDAFASPFEAVTDMYGTPAYGSKVDPNPFIAPFYIVFFGFMMADIGYGLILIFGCLAALKLMKPTGGMKKMLTLFMYCGVGTLIAGILTGSFFGDALSAFTSTFLGHEISVPVVWFNPLDEPIKMLIVSLLFGLAHILAGLGVNAIRQIREKDYIGAISGTFSWYIVVAGAGLMYFKVHFGLYLIILGVLLILVLGGHGQKGLGRITGGLSGLYSVVGYASDIFSYSRIMALGLSGAVVAQVFNRIGTMFGNSAVGVIVFVFAFAIGHLFNLATGVLGAYVHTSRLQFIEFFGKFFAEGGRPFKPLQTNTKYTTVTREDH